MAVDPDQQRIPVFLEAMMCVARTGALLWHLPEEYGKLDNLFWRLRRWVEPGVWDALLQRLIDLGPTDDRQHMFDSTSVRGHVSAAGEKGGSCERFRSIMALTTGDAGDHSKGGTALQAKTTPDAPIKDCLSASS